MIQHPSASFAFTARCRIVNRPGMLGQLTSAIGTLGGDIRGLDIVRVDRGAIVRDVTVLAADHSRARNLTIKRNCVAIVTDGSAVLGLGNIGPEAAQPVMEGKAMLFKEFGNVDAFPLCLATQDTDEIVATVVNIAPVFGGINLEDISGPRCFEIEERL